MKKIALLAFSMALAATVAGCHKDETTSKDRDLAGVNVAVGESSRYSKLFVLNEGAWQKNNATLDFFRIGDGNYVSDAFSKMNPTVTQGLGDTGNDLALHDGELWIVMNGSGMVHVVDAFDEELEASIAVPDPRYIAFDDDYAYVSSYAGAVYGGEPTKGKVYKIDADSYQIIGSVEVGCQPEGLDIVDGNLYVANSGGYNPVHEKTVSVIDLASFKVVGSVEVASNLKGLKADGLGSYWVSTYGEGRYDASWNYIQTEACSLHRVRSGKVTTVAGVHISCMDACDGNLWAIGNDRELEGGYVLTLYQVSHDLSVKKTEFGGTDLSRVNNPYGILVNPENGDLYIADASYIDAGKVHCFDKNLKHKWTATAGMLPAHMVLY